MILLIPLRFAGLRTAPAKARLACVGLMTHAREEHPGGESVLTACEDGQEERLPGLAASPRLAKRQSGFAIGLAGLSCFDCGLPKGEGSNTLLCGACITARWNVAFANDFLSKMGSRHPLSPMSQKALANSLSSSLSSSPSRSTPNIRDCKRGDAESEALCNFRLDDDHDQSVDLLEISVPPRRLRNDSQVRLQDQPMSCCGAEAVAPPALLSYERPLFTHQRPQPFEKNPDSVVLGLPSS